MSQLSPIGIFDSGYGGLTIFRDIHTRLPQYDYYYLGDNARVPYGNRSFETVYQYTLECVEKLFDMGCRLIILACNTASAKALRTIQQKDLPNYPELRKVLGIIRPTTEMIGSISQTKHIGILATKGTVQSETYLIEIEKFFPEVTVTQEACPIWVPLVEYNELNALGTDYFVQQHLERLLDQDAEIDTVLLACTHYPLLLPTIERHLPQGVKAITQGKIVSESLADYLVRHPEVEEPCSKNGSITFFTTESPEAFDEKGSLFFGQPIECQKVIV